ncbi:MAG: LacI family DNA-binding transcriptional regulator [Candidatus Binatia bacterium]
MPKSSKHQLPALQEIADHVGVSPATVSRVLNNRKSVAEKTRRKVLDAIEQVFHVQPPLDRMVGLIVPDASNPFYSELVFRFERALEDQGLHLLSSSSERRSDRELLLVRRLSGLGMRGLILITAGPSSESLRSLIASRRLPVVVCDRRVGAAASLDFVTVMSRQGMANAIEHLAAYGHRRIGFLCGPAVTESARERLESFRAAMAAHAFAAEWIFDGDFSLTAGRACADQLIELAPTNRPTAIVTANDLMAIGLMQHLQTRGWQLPRDLSVIGFDDIEWSEWTYPALTTLAQPLRRLVREAVRLLVARIREDEQEGAPRAAPEIVELGTMLVPRASVAAPFDSAS